MASDAAVKVFEGWFKNGRKSWSWSTLRACAIRHGEPYQTRSLRHRSGVIELNAELAAGFRKSTAKVWASLLHEDMPDEKDRVGTQLKDALTQFLEQVDAAVTSACPSISFKWRLLQKTLRRLIGRTHMAINDTFNKLLRKFQQIERSIEQEVSKAMRATYDNCGNMGTFSWFPSNYLQNFDFIPPFQWFYQLPINKFPTYPHRCSRDTDIL